MNNINFTHAITLHNIWWTMVIKATNPYFLIHCTVDTSTWVLHLFFWIELADTFLPIKPYTLKLDTNLNSDLNLSLCIRNNPSLGEINFTWNMPARGRLNEGNVVKFSETTDERFCFSLNINVSSLNDLGEYSLKLSHNTGGYKLFVFEVRHSNSQTSTQFKFIIDMFNSPIDQILIGSLIMLFVVAILTLFAIVKWNKRLTCKLYDLIWIVILSNLNSSWTQVNNAVISYYTDIQYTCTVCWCSLSFKLNLLQIQ